jgi:hypothetical protein
VVLGSRIRGPGDNDLCRSSRWVKGWCLAPHSSLEMVPVTTPERSSPPHGCMCAHCRGSPGATGLAGCICLWPAGVGLPFRRVFLWGSPTPPPSSVDGCGGVWSRCRRLRGDLLSRGVAQTACTGSIVAFLVPDSRGMVVVRLPGSGGQISSKNFQRLAQADGDVFAEARGTSQRLRHPGQAGLDGRNGLIVVVRSN